MDLKNELIQRIFKSWASSLLGVGLIVTLVVLAIKKEIEWETAYGWVTFGFSLISKKDTLTKI